jgi:APA family basic amino acid/polyamine antiporter
MAMQDSAKFNLVVTVMNVTTITFVIVLGAFHVKVDNWSNFFPFGVQGAFAGAGIVFFSYIGFDSVTTLAGEVARPSRDLPLGIVGTLSIATVLYVGISLVLTGMVNYKDINAVSPLSSAFDQVGMRWAAIIVSFGGVTALVAGVLCSLLGQPRIYYQMALDGLLPPQFAQVNSRQVPVFGTLVTAATAGLLAISFDLTALTAMISIGTLLAFTVVCAGIIVTRCRHPDADKNYRDPSWRRYFSVSVMLLVYFLASVGFSAGIKYNLEWWGLVVLGIPLVVLAMFFMLIPQPNIPVTFRCPLVPLLPLLGMLVNTFLIVQLNIDSIYRVIGWTVIGMIIYFGYGIRHSKLNFVPETRDASLNSGNGGFKKYEHVNYAN